MGHSMTEFKSRLYGQDSVFQSIRETIHDIPHLFITGPTGCGKTTFLEDLMTMLKKEAPYKIENILWLSSEKDRGIHTIRDKVNDFCKRAATSPGALRWIIIDDADTLPLISQQALRRPMETFAHLTRFIFASRHAGHLIEPLRSRCLLLELEPVFHVDLLPILLKDVGMYEPLFDFCVRHFINIHEVKGIVALYKSLLEDGKTKEEAMEKLKTLLPVSRPFTQELIRGLSTRNDTLIRENITKMFLHGFLLDDILLSIENAISVFPSTDPEVRFTILQFTMLGWISIQQGKEHWLDTMDIVEQVLRHNR